LANVLHERAALHQKHLRDIDWRLDECKDRLSVLKMQFPLDGGRAQQHLEKLILELERQRHEEEISFWKDTPRSASSSSTVPRSIAPPDAERTCSGAWRVRMIDGKSGRMEYVRQLCRRLRPVLGARMDEVFAAYCAEDADGRQQLETYLEMLSARHLSQGLDDGEPGLIPPCRAAGIRGDYPIGQVSYSGKGLYPFGLRENEWIQHMAILGRSGSGKTNIGFSILRTLVQKRKPFLVFDWKRNYRDLLTRPEFRGVEVYTIGRSIAPLRFNPLIPPAGNGPQDLAQEAQRSDRSRLLPGQWSSVLAPAGGGRGVRGCRRL
jgi:hypothetical protein